ncbi:DEAD/DEAH box helicase [Bartonella vinsonii]|uniref:Type III restriction-modification system StyLTI enzyme res n=1 Tax=Bartonella vinsonii TaxID=33047 RepID=A0A3S5C6H0_BARVI|nr:DEAD/DEAH box helicase family protein [Bartonella vinsonii]VEJ45363.1 type III restriction-modification system StyLTI enzyme res [Bartonella vinsonii]
MNAVEKRISARLSLRYPQHEALNVLSHVLDNIELSKNTDLAADLEAIKNLYPSVQDFERDFPSFCFALATGVGKTRLMGAFISYLYLTDRSRHFFILAPNLTIYEKLKQDFNPQSSKYVFSGMNEFVANRPVIVTGEDYESGRGIHSHEQKFRGQGRLFENSDTIFINIFNISKINTTDNKKSAAKSSVPRIKRLQETIGESYFDYLANLPDLVLLMDEAHRYRASAGASAINELKPVLGIELTATPKTIGAKPVDFKNVVYGYSLAEAMRDGFVKEPAVATRKDFQSQNYTLEQLEHIKLQDAIHAHEKVKADLIVYAKDYNKKLVKPFILVVAQDTEHAQKLRNLLEADDFFAGAYKGKVIEIHSKQSNTEEDKNIQKLVAIENPNEPTEIVIHVNKLKEGWDVTNLYTIVPLRASASEILTEQTIGRGLRLPYGCKTGVEAIDRLTIIAHDRFQDIIDRANDPNSIIKKHIEIGGGGDIPCKKSDILTVPSRAETESIKTTVTYNFDINGASDLQDVMLHDAVPSLFISEEKKIADVAWDIIKGYEKLPSSQLLNSVAIQEKISNEVMESINLSKESLALDTGNTETLVKKVVVNLTEKIAELTIDIPNIMLIPSREVTYGFSDFDLENLEILNLQPVSKELLIRELRTHKSIFLISENKYIKEPYLENYIIRGLIDHDFIDYDSHTPLLRKLASQMVQHFQSYLPNDAAVENVLIHYQHKLNTFIVDQLRAHQWETKKDYEVKVTRGFTTLTPIHYTLPQGTSPLDFRRIPSIKSDIKTFVFKGFAKCCYPLQKFDSVEGELRFSQILEDDVRVLKWMKPARGFFKIEYDKGFTYEPDFVVETKDAKYLCEPKKASEMQNPIVLKKRNAAVQWCYHATHYATTHGGKPWYYVLIPHDEIKANSSFEGLCAEFTIS